MKQSILFLLLLFSFIQSALAQRDIPFDKAHFSNDKIGLKNAISAIEDADAYVEIDEDFHSAIILYKEAYELNSNNSSLNFKIGKSYVHCGTCDRTKALKYLEKALKINSEVSNLLSYYLGRAYHYSSNWKKAISYYNKHIRDYVPPKKGDPNSEYIIGNVSKRVSECQMGLKFSKDVKRVFIDNLGAKINSKFSDFAPVISADESLLFFTSRRTNSTGGKLDINQEYYEDIYFSTTSSKKKKWTYAKNIGPPINTKGHDAVVGLTPGGEEILVFRNGDLYAYIFEGTTWHEPVKFPKWINQKRTRETSASFSPDKKTLYFVSDTEENSLGGHDIFVSEQKANGVWGTPRNLSSIVNTIHDEEGIFIHPDGKTMYFSSNGHSTIGGYDIFKSVLVDGQWTTPENLGLPINTPDDDLFFVLDAGGKHGYYASNRKGGFGEKDIYKITFLGAEKPTLFNTEDNLIASIAKPIEAITFEPTLELATNELTVFKGNVLDFTTKEALSATLEVTDNSTGETVANVKSNTSTGKFLITLPSGKNYGISVKSKHYLFHSENFNLPKGGNFQEVNKDVLLKDIRVGSNIVLKNTFFDHNKSTLKTESKQELANAFQLMKENPTLRIEISGHTDSVGSDSYNERLSKARAKSVVEYLENLGIDNSRLVYKGLGEKKPIADNKTEDGRALNRRTELKVIGI